MIDLIERAEAGDKNALKKLKNHVLAIEADALAKQPRFLDEVEAREYREGREYVPFGFSWLDDYVQIPSSALTLIYMITNHGKTTFLKQLMYNFVKRGKRVLFLTYEDAAADVYAYLPYAYYIDMIDAGIFSADKYPRLSYGEYERFFFKNKRIKKYDDELYKRVLSPIREREKTGTGQVFIRQGMRTDTVERLPLIIEAFLESKKTEVDVVIVDYIQRIPTSERSHGRQEAIEIAVNALQVFAAEYKLPVVSAAQLNFKGIRGEKRHDYVNLGNVRSAADISNAARLVIGGFNAHQFDRQMRQEEADFVFDINAPEKCYFDILKDKGQVATSGIVVQFNPYTYRFEAFDESAYIKNWGAHCDEDFSANDYKVRAAGDRG